MDPTCTNPNVYGPPNALMDAYRSCIPLLPNSNPNPNPNPTSLLISILLLLPLAFPPYPSSPPPPPPLPPPTPFSPFVPPASFAHPYSALICCHLIPRNSTSLHP